MCSGGDAGGGGLPRHLQHPLITSVTLSPEEAEHGAHHTQVTLTPRVCVYYSLSADHVTLANQVSRSWSGDCALTLYHCIF